MPKLPNVEENQVLKTQIEASIGAARAVVESWLPPPKEGEKADDDDEQDSFFHSITGRPDRLGLGAKYISHKEATQHQQPTSRQALQLKNKIINQNQRAQSASAPEKRGRSKSDDEDEEESRTTIQPKKKPNAGQPAGGQGDFLSTYLAERANKKKKKKKKNAAKE